MNWVAGLVISAFMVLLFSSSAIAWQYSLDRVVLAKILKNDIKGTAAEFSKNKRTQPYSDKDTDGIISGSSFFSRDQFKETGAPYEENLSLRTSFYPFEGTPPFLPTYRPSHFDKNGHKPKTYTSAALDFEFSSVIEGTKSGRLIDVSAAFVTQVVLHEIGHDIMADHISAEGSSLSFLTSRDGQFFLALSTVEAIEDHSRLPYNMGGEFAADLTFEYALNSYRGNPTLYNKSLMFFSGTDLLWYSLYAFYLSDGHEALDPVAITRYNGISKEAVLSVAVAKTIINAYRIYTGEDKVVPHFLVDNDSVTLNFRVPF
jgi:hypothetical protein